MNITDFLQARIAEDEAVARAAIASHAPDEVWESELGSLNLWPEDIAFWAGWTPYRALSECAAKRAIIKLAEDVESLDYQVTSEWGGEIDGTADAILQTLATIYKDHPDYRTEWA